MSTSYWLDQSSKIQKKNYDVVIVGAGISGLSTAYWLNQEDPSLKVAILEKDNIASGATGRNAGFVTCGSVEHFNRMVSKHGEKTALEIWKFAEENMKLLKSCIIQDSKDLEFEQKGAYSLAAGNSEMKELKEVADLMANFNIPVESYNENDIEKNVGTKGFVGGIKYCNDGSVNPVLLAKAIADKSQFDFYSSTEVYNWIETPGGHRLIKTSHGDFETSLIIFCTNGYSSSLHSYFKDKVYPTRGQIMMLEPVEQFMDGPCYANFYLDYFRQTQNGALLIGGFRQLEKETEVGFSDHTTDLIQDALHDFVKKHLPQYDGKRVTHRWAGVMGFSQDGEPFIGSLPHDNQVFFCAGFTGHGLGLAFHTAKKMTALIFGQSIPDWLSAKRF